MTDIRAQGEIRVTNEKTGGQKGKKPQRYDLIPWSEMDKVAELYAFGATKYADHNWRKGYAWSLSFASLIRHATSFWEGEALDPETGVHHMTSVVFHALALMYFEDHYPDLDDRFKQGGPVEKEVANDTTVLLDGIALPPARKPRTPRKTKRANG